jgi:hypothetical protein
MTGAGLPPGRWQHLPHRVVIQPLFTGKMLAVFKLQRAFFGDVGWRLATSGCFGSSTIGVEGQWLKLLVNPFHEAPADPKRPKGLVVMSEATTRRWIRSANVFSLSMEEQAIPNKW